LRGKPASHNVRGIYSDGSKFAAPASLDGGGFAYSKEALGSTQLWDGVLFNLGPNRVTQRAIRRTILAAMRLNSLQQRFYSNSVRAIAIHEFIHCAKRVRREEFALARGGSGVRGTVLAGSSFWFMFVHRTSVTGSCLRRPGETTNLTAGPRLRVSWLMAGNHDTGDRDSGMTMDLSAIPALRGKRWSPGRVRGVRNHLDFQIRFDLLRSANLPRYRRRADYRPTSSHSGGCSK
jgi:hypothetical protein